jgi:hypothetical protein
MAMGSGFLPFVERAKQPEPPWANKEVLAHDSLPFIADPGVQGAHTYTNHLKAERLSPRDQRFAPLQHLHISPRADSRWLGIGLHKGWGEVTAHSHTKQRQVFGMRKKGPDEDSRQIQRVEDAGPSKLASVKARRHLLHDAPKVSRGNGEALCCGAALCH